MNSCDEDWEQFLMNDDVEDINFCNNIDNTNKNIPKCSDIYISTKTKISYLNKNIDLNSDFWKIQVINYNSPIEGVVKKQIKINSKRKKR